jgi:Family of unknown function (DUF5695)
MLKPDPLSGDYGPNFFGHAWNTATYVVNHPQFGWLAFGGNVRKEGDPVKVTPLDSFRARIYLASLGLWLTLDAGSIQSVEVNTQTGTVRVGLAAATSSTPSARLRIEQPAHLVSGIYRPVKSLSSERGAWVVPLGKNVTWLELQAK